MALINLRNALMAGKRLPYDAEVEFLGSTGTQWIDTGVYGNETSEVSLDVQVLQLSESKAVFGAFGNSDRSIYLYQAGALYPNKWQVGFGSYTNVGTRDTDRHVFAFSNFKVSKDGTQIASFPVRTFTTPHTLLLFNMHNNSGGTYDSMATRVYSCKIWKNGVLVRDFIPVRRGTVGYLYDRVSGRLFGNAGTGAFGYGNDLKYPIPAS